MNHPIQIALKDVTDILIPALAKELAWIEEQKEYQDLNTSCDWYTTRAQLLKDLRLMTGLDRPKPKPGPYDPDYECDHCGTVLPETRLRHFRLCQDCIGLHTPLPDKIKRWVTYHQATGRPDWTERWDYEPKARPFEVGRVALEVPA